ncbi:hypothetical protein Taro_024492 [Colocasia esculenta]|uniref:Response regulatory domain-containing protein n=1 Tax=Colocasia esculenta TaxID=4460 RepID=A0A843VKI6_COLES|nr:hypothetical protein [Colocasia esculenta]
MAITAEAQFHVLAVDDSLLDRKLIERLLKTSSYQVTTVDSGSKALEFLGLQHEQSSSPSVFPYHQETSSLKDIPVVIMSSENVPSRINRCLEEGAEEFFLKPVQKSDMERLIPHIMKRKTTEQQKEEQLEEQEQLPPQQQLETSHDTLTVITTDNSNSNKRKAMDEALSPERTRPRCTVTA